MAVRLSCAKCHSLDKRRAEKGIIAFSTWRIGCVFNETINGEARMNTPPAKSASPSDDPDVVSAHIGAGAQKHVAWINLAGAVGVALIAAVPTAWLGVKSFAKGAVEHEAPGAVSTELDKASSETRQLRNQLDESERKMAMLASSATQLAMKIGELEDELVKNVPAAGYQRTILGQPTEGLQLSIAEPPVGTTVDFAHRLYDTHDAWKPGQRSYFEAPKDGIYSISAYVSCDQLPRGQLRVGVCVDQPPGGNIETFPLATTLDYSPQSTIGGTVDVPLKKGQRLDIRVYPGRVQSSFLAFARVAIQYRCRLPEE